MFSPWWFCMFSSYNNKLLLQGCGNFKMIYKDVRYVYNSSLSSLSEDLTVWGLKMLQVRSHMNQWGDFHLSRAILHLHPLYSYVLKLTHFMFLFSLVHLFLKLHCTLLHYRYTVLYLSLPCTAIHRVHPHKCTCLTIGCHTHITAHFAQEGTMSPTFLSFLYLSDSLHLSTHTFYSNTEGKYLQALVCMRK